VRILDDYDFEFQPSANKRKINELKKLNYVEPSENVIFLGSPGVGKLIWLWVWPWKPLKIPILAIFSTPMN